MSRWFRVYEDLVDDPKVQRLPADLFRALVNLWCLASSNDGKLPTISDIAFKLRMTEDKAGNAIATLQAAGLLDSVHLEQETLLCPHNWNARQFKSDVSTDRVKQHRQRKRNVSPSVSETSPEADTDTDTESSAARGLSGIVKQDRAEVELRSAAGERAPSSDFDAILALIDKGYDLVKDIIPVVRDRAGKATKAIGSWRYFVPAIEEAKAANKAIRPKASGTPAEPVTWLPAESPLWAAMAERWQHAKGKELYAAGSSHAPGLGAFIPAAWIEFAQSDLTGSVN